MQNPVKPTLGQKPARHFYRISGLGMIYMIRKHIEYR